MPLLQPSSSFLTPFSLLWAAADKSSTTMLFLHNLGKDELIFLTSYISQAHIQVVCSSIEEAITRIV